jgi:hypothetical protein
LWSRLWSPADRAHKKGAGVTANPSEDLERETGFEPATLSLGMSGTDYLRRDSDRKTGPVGLDES